MDKFRLAGKGGIITRGGSGIGGPLFLLSQKEGHA